MHQRRVQAAKGLLEVKCLISCGSCFLCAVKLIKLWDLLLSTQDSQKLSSLLKPRFRSTDMSHSHKQLRHHSHTVLGKISSKVIPSSPGDQGQSYEHCAPSGSVWQ